jgi:hypothetical protein
MVQVHSTTRIWLVVRFDCLRVRERRGYRLKDTIAISAAENLVRVIRNEL